MGTTTAVKSLGNYSKVQLGRHNTVCVYDGPSAIDGARIIVLISGLVDPSINTKTGDMLQGYVLRADVDPAEAAKLGLDVSVCGACALRPIIAKLFKAIETNGVECYVDKVRGPAGVWKSWKAGNVPYVTPAELAVYVETLRQCPGVCRYDCQIIHTHAIHAALIDGCECYACRFASDPTLSAEYRQETFAFALRDWEATVYPKSGHSRARCAKIGHATKPVGLRDGAYGDPAGVPIEVWEALHVNGGKRTSYTHRWETSPEFAPMAMASIDSQTFPDVDDALDRAHAAGFRTYRALRAGESKRDDEMMCPEGEVGPDGKPSGVQCARCGACDGARVNPKTGRVSKALNIAIRAIGA